MKRLITMMVLVAGIAWSQDAPAEKPVPTLEQIRTMALKEYLAIGNKTQAEMNALLEQQKKLQGQLPAVRMRDKERAKKVEGEIQAIQFRINQTKPTLDEMTDLYKRAKTDDSYLFGVIRKLDKHPELGSMAPFSRYHFKQPIDATSILANGLSVQWGPDAQLEGTATLVHLTGIENAGALAEGDFIDGALVRKVGSFQYTTVLGAQKSIPSYKIIMRLRR